jgi:hypothetical protein
LTLDYLLLLLEAVLFSQLLGQLHLGLFEFLPLLGKVEVGGSEGEDGRLEGRKLCAVFLSIVGQNWAELLIDEGIVAFLRLASLNSLGNPSLELEMLSVGSAVQSELEIFFALPEHFRLMSEYFPPLLGDLLLVLVVIVRIIR